MTSLENDPRLWDRINRMPIEERERLLSQIRPRIIDPYVPHVPHPTQQVFLSLTSEREVFFGGAAGGGKDLACATTLLTTAGWKTMGTVEPGDFVYDETGRPTEVLAVGPVELKPCHALRWSTGETITAGNTHRWVVQTAADRQSMTRAHPAFLARRRAGRPSRSRGEASLKPGTGAAAALTNARRAEEARVGRALPDPWDYTRTLETHEIARLAASEPRALTVPRPAACQAPGCWELATSPWALGMWLGDGTTSNATIAHGDEDAESLIKAMTTDGYPFVRQAGPLFYFAGLRADLDVDLGRYRAPKSKRIPDAVFRAPFADRLAVAQGLVDSDGHVNEKGQVEFCLTLEPLFRDCLRLFASLGVRVSWSESVAAYTKDGVRHVTGIRYRTKFTTELPIATYARKLARIDQAWVDDDHSGNRSQLILRSITPATPSLTRCIQVANPRGIYLVGDTLIPTHNSDAILMAALQYVDVPGYAALILRKTFKDLTLPGAIMDRANDWLMNTPARKRNGGQYWEFPTGPGRKPATLSFGHLMYHSSTEQYRGAELTFIAVDELTQFEERTYDFMFSRLRRPALPCENCPRQVEQNPEGERGVWRHKELAPGTRVRSCDYPKPNRTAIDEYPASNVDGMTTLFDVPLRMRTSSNPGGVGFSWVRDRFVDPRTRKPGARFVPSKLTDNPSLDQESYRESLSRMGRKTRLQLEEGLWDVVDENAMLPRHYFPAVEDWPKDKTQYVRYWDLAATAPAPGKTPDWTVGALLALTSDGVWYLVDLRRVQATPAEVERLVTATAQQDVQRVGGVLGRVKIAMEQEPGSAGVGQIATYRRLLAGYPFTGDRPSGSKEERARPLAVAAENSNFKILTAPWNRPFLDECEAFPYGPHDDQVDAVTGAMKMLVPARGKAKLLV